MLDFFRDLNDDDREVFSKYSDRITKADFIIFYIIMLNYHSNYHNNYLTHHPNHRLFFIAILDETKVFNFYQKGAKVNR